LVHEGRELSCEEGLEVIRSAFDFIEELDPAVHQLDHILKVVTPKMIAATSSVPGLELRRQ